MELKIKLEQLHQRVDGLKEQIITEAKTVSENRFKGKVLFPKKLAEAKAIFKRVNIPAILKS